MEIVTVTVFRVQFSEQRELNLFRPTEMHENLTYVLHIMVKNKKFDSYVIILLLVQALCVNLRVYLKN